MTNERSPMDVGMVTPAQLWNAGIRIGDVVALASPTTGERVVGTMIGMHGCPIRTVTVRIIGTAGQRSVTRSVSVLGMGGFVFDVPTHSDLHPAGAT